MVGRGSRVVEFVVTFAFGEQITVTTRTQQVDDSGDPVYDDYGNPVHDTSTVVVVGAFDPAIGFERTDGMDQVQVQPTAYLPSGTAVDSTSKLTIRGLDYEVDGDVESWRSPFTGWRPGIQAPLKRVTG